MSRNLPHGSGFFSGHSGRSSIKGMGKDSDIVNETDVEMSMAEDSGLNASHPTYPGENVTTRGKMTVISSNSKAQVEIPDLSVADYTVKISLSLYKVQQSIYLLDFQKMTGDAFSFMTLCSNIITELKTLSAASKQQQAMLAQQHATQLQRIQQQQAMK